ncbi:MAG: hypothetical protein Q9169_005006 [Polycauliona sp. 2 TL-2023]
MSSLFDSPIFSIYAGPARKQFHVHASSLRQSPVLAKIIDGDWKESEDRTIDLAEWDVLTIDQCLHFLYFKHYHMLTPVLEQPVPVGDVEAKVPSGVPVCTCDCAEMAHPVQSGTQSVFTKPAHGITDTGTADHQPFETADVNTEPEHLDTARAFSLLQHAKLYVLAQYLELTDLKTEAYQHLAALMDLLLGKLIPKLLKYMVQLIRYVYTSTDTLKNSNEPLRELVAIYVAGCFQHFHGEDADKLMEEGGDFVVDVMKNVQHRVLHDMTAFESKMKMSRLRALDEKNELLQEVAKYKKRLRKRGGRLAEAADGDDTDGHVADGGTNGAGS